MRLKQATTVDHYVWVAAASCLSAVTFHTVNVGDQMEVSYSAESFPHNWIPLFLRLLYCAPTCDIAFIFPLVLLLHLPGLYRKARNVFLTWFLNVRQTFKKHFIKIKANRIKPQLWFIQIWAWQRIEKQLELNSADLIRKALLFFLFLQQLVLNVKRLWRSNSGELSYVSFPSMRSGSAAHSQTDACV